MSLFYQKVGTAHKVWGFIEGVAPDRKHYLVSVDPDNGQTDWQRVLRDSGDTQYIRFTRSFNQKQHSAWLSNGGSNWILTTLNWSFGSSTMSCVVWLRKNQLSLPGNFPNVDFDNTHNRYKTFSCNTSNTKECQGTALLSDGSSYVWMGALGKSFSDSDTNLRIH